MHAGEVDIDADLVHGLLADQFPRVARLQISAVQPAGTVNAVYRIGSHLCARLPRVQSWVRDLERECHWLPRLAPHLSLRVPQPVVKGRPALGYPFPWAIYRWIAGEPYADDLVDDERRAAGDLARFVAELRLLSSRGAPPGGRAPLHDLDPATRTAIDSSRQLIDADAAVSVWEDALGAPPWAGRDVWIHGDLLRPNVLVEDGRLRAVIDFGAAGIGDPATDVIAAWSVFGRTGREAFRDGLDVDDATWRRARGIALHQAVGIIPYYPETNPGFVSQAKRTVQEVVADFDG
jgi:aminoglycoside phosphotransferase (APT) family kinase protein